MKLRTILFLLSFLAILSLTTGGLIYYSFLKKSAWLEAETQSAYHSEKIKNFISNYLTSYQKAVKALSGQKELQKALTNPDEANIAEANIILDHFTDSFEVDVSYLMDQKGNTIASSNRNSVTSFIGNNYSFRPYFKEAILGNPSVYLASGVTSQKRGVYYSHPLHADREKNPIGVVVMKAGVEAIEKEFINIPSSPGMITVLTGPYGAVFISDHTEFLFRLLWRIADEKKAEIVISEQFGKGPFVWAGFEKKNKSRAVDQSGNEYLMFQKSIESLPGWNVVHLNNIKVNSEIMKAPFIGVMGYVLLALCVFVGLSVFILYNIGKSDIKKRLETEDKLQLTLTDLNKSQKIAHVGNWKLDLVTDVFSSSEEGLRIFGFPANSSPTFREMLDCIIMDDRQQALAVYKHSIKTGNPYSIEIRITRKDTGELRNIQSNAEIQCRPDGRAMIILGTNQDITERKRAEEESRRLASIIRHSRELVNMATPDGTMFFLNDTGKKMLGISEKDIAKTNIISVIPEHLRDKVRQEVLPSISKNGYWEGELQYLNLNTGGLIDVYAITFKIADPETDTLQFYANVSLDITGRKQAEEENQKLQNQLAQAQKMESIGRLAGGVAHDFNNMLSVIIGRAELALMKLQPSDPLYADLHEIEMVGKRSADLTQQLLAFARKQTIAPRIINLNNIIKNMFKMMQQLIGEDLDLLWKPAANLWTVKVDPTQIDQILANLVVNARDAIKDVGKVTIETENVMFDEAYCAAHTGSLPGQYVLLAVSDNGCGMNQETMQRIFEPFFTTKPTGQGTGLGLAMIYGIVKQNNGFINVYSEPGKGTTFRIYIPRFDGNAEKISTKTLTETTTGGSETILLVEDEKSILEVARIMLEKLGYTMLIAGTPDAAIRLAGEHAGKIDLLITDVVMPEMNGRDLARHLRSLYPNLKQIFMSGYTANVIAHHGVLEDGVYFIQKPFSIKDLAAKVREALEQK
jgi:two-component system, cell cycle sensor histidine kinase and response regulator CckA